MGLLVALHLVFSPTPEEAAAVAATDRVHLTVEKAADHVRAARQAAALTGTDPSVLLAVAAHESGYKADEVTREPPRRLRRVSCGVMTPVPKHGCEPWELTVDGGYYAGAEHLAEYLEREGNLRRALVAYAGGHGSVVYPRAGWRGWRSMRWVTKRAALIREAVRKARPAS